MTPDCILPRILLLALHHGSRNGQPPLHQTFRTPQLKAVWGIFIALAMSTHSTCHSLGWQLDRGPPAVRGGKPRCTRPPLAQNQADKKKFKLFSWESSLPQTPTSSPLLSQPTQARFERFSQIGRCRGLQGWEVLERYQARDWPGGPGPAHTCFSYEKKNMKQ